MRAAKAASKAGEQLRKDGEIERGELRTEAARRMW
jgi:hypothetical protein